MDKTLKKARMLTVFVCLTWALGAGALPIRAEEPPVEDDICMTCHEGYAESLRFTAHALSSQMTEPAQQLACVSCHSNGTEHIEEPTTDNIGNPERMTGDKAAAACAACHQPHHERTNVGFDPHTVNNTTCNDCHSIHEGHEGLLLDSEAGFCEDCHTAVVNQFRRRSNHPVTDGNVTCLSCHELTGDNEPAFGHGSSANCFTCHPETSGPFLFEHRATSSFSTEGDGGCVTCHEPHGSPNRRLLNQPGDALCQQCHGVPPLHRTFHEGIGSQFGCVECHNAVHGSNDNPGLLDENLGTKLSGTPAGCSCHNVDN